ncbi:hypothetical protein [Kribbella sp. NPDC051770]|uniref:hypothetical protein n=1 Tax=Kribbella sp. NPDC051770 TaxID=3155413 RepID=UPI003423F4F5
MRRSARRLSSALALLALVGCTPHTEAPAALSTPQATAPLPTAPITPTATSTVSVDGSPATFRYTKDQLVRVVPPTYRGRAMDRFTYLIELESYSWRDDFFAGQPVKPESCRVAVRSAGRVYNRIDGFRTDTPAVMGSVTLPTPAGDGVANVRVYELTGAEAVRYQRQVLQPAPECREFTVGASGRGSIVERPLPEFGSTSRYVVRTYPRSGHVWIERTLQLQTTRTAVELRVFSTDNSEQQFLAFARQVRASAVRELR